MVDLATEVVQAAASGAASRLTASGLEAVTRLVSALRTRFRGDAEAREALEVTLDEPGDAGVRGELESLLRERIQEDSELASWLAALWAEIAPDIKVDDKTANIVHGTVHGDVIQARDVHGGIHIGRHSDAG